MRLLKIAAFSLFIYLLFLGTAFAEELAPGLEMTVELGYNGFIQQGTVNPVIVNLENTTADMNLSGELVLEHHGVEYVTRLELATPSKKRYYLYYPADSFQRNLVIRIRTGAFSAHREFVTSRRFIDAGSANIMVLDSQSGSLGILSKLPGVRMQRNLHESHVPVLTESETFVAYYNIDEIDFNPKFFSRADTIILGDFDYQQVTPELVNVLKACISGGASLIFSLGNNANDVAGSPLSELCPLQVNGTIHTEDLGSFGKRYRISAAGRPATLTTGDVAPGAEVVEWVNEYPVVVRKTHGCGSITALAFDYTAVPFKQQPAVAPIFVDNALSIRDSVQVRDWYIHPQKIGSILRGLGEAKAMSPGFVLLFLLCYVVLIGPANFLILGRLKRRTLVWTTIPLLIFGFSYLGLSTGYLYRGSNNVTATFQELHIYPDSEYMPYQTTMLVFTAERSKYVLEIPDQYAFLYPDIPMVVQMPAFGGSGGGRLRGMVGGKIDNSGKPSVEVSQGKWTSKQYTYSGYLPITATVSADLKTSFQQNSTGVSGDITLDLPFDLYDCSWLSPHSGLISCGNLTGRGTYDVTDLSSDLQGLLPEENYLVAEIKAFRGMMKNAVQPGLDYRNEALLVGFTQDVENRAEYSHPSVDHNLTMVVVHLPYEKRVSVTGKPTVSPPLLVGGAKFSPYPYDIARSGATGDLYFLPAESYIDVSYTISGQLDTSSFISMSLVGQETVDNEKINDYTDYLAVEHWDGENWRSSRITPNMTNLDVRFGSAINTKNREVVVRFRALKELVLGLPIKVVAF